MKGLEQYRSVNNQSSVTDADSHQLITLLFDKVVESLVVSKAHISNDTYDKKSNALNKAIEIIGALREFLDMDQGGDVALRLEQLYEWSERTLFAANIENSIEKVDQVEHVIREIREGWLGIREQVEIPTSS